MNALQSAPALRHAVPVSTAIDANIPCIGAKAALCVKCLRRDFLPHGPGIASSLQPAISASGKCSNHVVWPAPRGLAA